MFFPEGGHMLGGHGYRNQPQDFGRGIFRGVVWGPG